MTDRMTAEDWRRFMDEAPRLMDVLDRYEAMGRRTSSWASASAKAPLD